MDTGDHGTDARLGDILDRLDRIEGRFDAMQAAMARMGMVWAEPAAPSSDRTSRTTSPAAAPDPVVWPGSPPRIEGAGSPTGREAA